MSTASKITLGCSLVFAAGTFFGVNYLQYSERNALRQGPIKDAKRMADKQAYNKKQLTNDLEHREQIMLKEKFAKVQPLNAEIIRAEEED